MRIVISRYDTVVIMFKPVHHDILQYMPDLLQYNIMNEVDTFLFHQTACCLQSHIHIVCKEQMRALSLLAGLGCCETSFRGTWYIPV